MAVFEDEIIPNYIGGSFKNGLRALGLPKSMVKLTADGLLRAVIFAKIPLDNHGATITVGPNLAREIPVKVRTAHVYELGHYFRLDEGGSERRGLG